MRDHSPTPDLSSTAPRWRRELAVQALVLLAMIGVFFPGVFLRGERATGADLLFQSPPWNAYAPADYSGPGNAIMPDIVTAMLPYYALTQQALAHGQWPLWNPLEMAGMPLLANCQSAVLYPPRLLHAILDLHTATSCYYLLKLWLCGMTAFLCARGLGVGLFGARFFSIAWAFNGFNLVWCYWPLPDVSAWLPVLFYGVEMAVRQQVRPAIFGVAAGGALMLLAGHPESAFTQALGAGLYLALRLALATAPPRALLRAALACAAGWILALGVTAAQWMPFIEYLLNSYTLHTRSGDSFENVIPPMGLLTLFVPRFLGTNADGAFWGDNTFNLHAYYPGLVTWAGIFAAFALLRRREQRPMIGALFLAAAICTLWAFNVPGITDIFQVPGIHALRRNYNIAFAVFAACLLGAYGLEAFLAARERRLAWAGIALGGAMACAVVYVGHDFTASLARMKGMAPYVQTQLLTAAVFAVLALAVLAFATRLRRAHAAAGAVLILLFADLAWNLHGMNPTVPPAHIFPETALTKALRALPQPARVQAGAGYVASGLLVPYGIEDWLGYDGLYPDRVLRFNVAMGPEIWKAAEPICAIPWYLRNPEIAAHAKASVLGQNEEPFPVTDSAYFERVAAHDGLELYRNKKALPRAYVAGAVEAFPDRDAIFAALKRETFVPGAVVYTEDLPAGALPQTPGPAGSAEITEYTPNRVRLRVQAERPAALVLSDAWYPGWRATVNGKDATIFPAYYAFRSVLVPQGGNEVVFEYFPRSFQLGLAVSIATMLASLAAVFIAFPRRASPQ